MIKPSSKPLFFATCLGLLLTTAPCEAAWNVSSEFKLKLDSGLFDTLLKDFWSTLNGKKTVALPNIQLHNPIEVAIKGIKAHVAFDFPPPVRIGNTREWELASSNFAATLTVDKIDATQDKVIDQDGIIIHIRINGECHNVQLQLPAHQTHILARARADLIDGKVKLSLPSFQANWPMNSWQIVSMDCSGPDGFGEQVAQQALSALGSIHNFDQQINEYLVQSLDKWSVDASTLLLAGQEVPTHRDDLRVFYEPARAEDASDGSISLEGNLRFNFPFASQDHDVDNFIALDRSTDIPATAATSSLLLPFDSISSLLMGSYMSGSFNYEMLSSDSPGFVSLLNNFWAKLFVWPDLFHFKKTDVFRFKTFFMGAPSILDPQNAGPNNISAQIFMPIAVRTYAPRDGQYVPYVEFRSELNGPSQLKIAGEKAVIQVNTNNLKISKAWSNDYKAKYHPNTHIGTGAIAGVLKNSLNTQGLELPLPQLKVGAQTKLVPTSWQLEGKNLRLQFAPSAATNDILNQQ